MSAVKKTTTFVLLLLSDTQTDIQIDGLIDGLFLTFLGIKAEKFLEQTPSVVLFLSETSTVCSDSLPFFPEADKTNGHNMYSWTLKLTSIEVVQKWIVKPTAACGLRCQLLHIWGF